MKCATITTKLPVGLAAALLLALCWTASLAETVAEGRDEAPVVTVGGLHDALIEAMRHARDLGFQGRFTQLDPIIHASFDFQTIARLVIGARWKDFSEQQRDQFLDIFQRLTTATYAARFDSYEGEQFSTLARESLKRERVLVKTELITSTGKKVSLDYLLHNREGKWRIINAIANGVSDLSLKRAEYAAILQDGGFEALLSKLSEQVANYEQGGDGSA